MKINYKRLKEILEPYGIIIEGNRVNLSPFRFDNNIFTHLDNYNDSVIVQSIKNNIHHPFWSPTVNMLITILHPYYNEIFEREINKDKLINVIKKYTGWEIEDDKTIKIRDFNHKEFYHRYYIDDLIDVYCNNGKSVSATEDAILSFMHYHEDEIME